MAEYAILLAASGTRWLDRLHGMVVDDPAVLWGGAAVLLLLAVWVLKPTR